MFISLKPLERTGSSPPIIIARLRGKLAHVPGATLYLQASQDLRIGGRMSNAQYQFTMRGDNSTNSTTCAPRCSTAVADPPRAHRCEQRSAEQGLQT